MAVLQIGREVLPLTVQRQSPPDLAQTSTLPHFTYDISLSRQHLHAF